VAAQSKLSKQSLYCWPAALLLFAAAGLWQSVAAAAPVLADTLPMLLATQQQQQQAPATAAGTQPDTSIDERVPNSAACLIRCLVELFQDLVTVAAAIPSAAAAAAGRNEWYDYAVMLKDPSMLAAVAPMAELALALLRTPLSSSSNSSRANNSSSSTIIPQDAVVVRTIQDHRVELNAIITTAAQLAVAFVDPPMNVQQPAAISQLLMVNLAYTALYERSKQPRRSRRQQQDDPTSAPASQLLVALGLPEDDVNEQIGTSPLLRGGDMRRLRYQIETALFALYWGFVDVAYDDASDSDSEESEDCASGSNEAAANARSGSSIQQQQRQQQRHVDAAGQHIVPTGVHELLVMTVLEAILSRSFAPDMRVRFSVLMTATAVAGFAMVLLPDAEPHASAKAAAAAVGDALACANIDDNAALDAAIAAANAASDAAADAVAGSYLRLLRAVLLQLTPFLLKEAEQHCSATGQKPLDLRSDKLPREGCVLAMLRRAVGGVACDEARAEAEAPAAGETWHMYHLADYVAILPLV
jgi:hypothetical protein